MKTMHIKIILMLSVLTVLGLAACAQPQRPLTAAELLSLGERYLLELNFEQALVHFTNLIEVEPMNPRGYTGAAEAHLGLGQPGQAIIVLERGQALMPHDPSINNMLAILHEPGSNPGESAPDTDNTRETEDANENAATAGIIETVYAPFTPEQRVLIDRICDAILAQEYEYALALMEMPEMLDIMGETASSFVYRDIFMFSSSPTTSGMFTRRGINVYVDKTHDGTGRAVRISTISGRTVSSSEVWYSSSIWFDSVVGGVLNGMNELRRFSPAPGGELILLETGYALNGYRHGEWVTTHFDVAFTSSSVFDNGFYVPFGPANEHGAIPAIKHESSFDVRFTYLPPNEAGIGMPFAAGGGTMHDWRLLDFTVRIPHYK